jgi:hypothetical protein
MDEVNQIYFQDPAGLELSTFKKKKKLKEMRGDG